MALTRRQPPGWLQNNHNGQLCWRCGSRLPNAATEPDKRFKHFVQCSMLEMMDYPNAKAIGRIRRMFGDVVMDATTVALALYVKKNVEDMDIL